MAIALTKMEALCGFRPINEIKTFVKGTRCNSINILNNKEHILKKFKNCAILLGKAWQSNY